MFNASEKAASTDLTSVVPSAGEISSDKTFILLAGELARVTSAAKLRGFLGEARPKTDSLVLEST